MNVEKSVEDVEKWIKKYHKKQNILLISNIWPIKGGKNTIYSVKYSHKLQQKEVEKGGKYP